MKIKAVTRPRKDKEGKVPIYIRIADANRTRYVSTGLKVKPANWNKRKGRIGKADAYTDEQLNHINKTIRDKENDAKDEFYKLKAEDRPVNAELVKKHTKSDNADGSFIKYAEKFAERKRRKNIQTGRRYDAIVSKLKEYTGGSLKLNEITVSWLKTYSDWLATERNNKPNTIHSNLRAIRAILYSAIEEGLFPQERNPFFKFKLKQPKVSKTKLSAEEIKAFSKQDADTGFQELARDLFLFSFFTQGMRFRDVATLKDKHLTDTKIVYEMTKTGNAQEVKLVPAAKRLIEKYRRDERTPEDFVFPLIDVDKILRNLKAVDKRLTVKDLTFKEAPTGKQQEIQKELDRDISSKNAYVNKEIKKVAKAAEISKDISFHVARHSYADIGRSKKTDLHELSNSLGHSSLSITESYLSSLGNESSNQAAETIYADFD